VTTAEIDYVDPDVTRATEFLDQAQRILADAERPDLSFSGSTVLYYQACLSAMDAVLTAAGRRVTSGIDSHRVRIREVAALIGGGYEDLMERMDEWRRDRGEVSYAAVEPPAASVAGLQADARDMVAAASEFVRAH